MYKKVDNLHRFQDFLVLSFFKENHLYEHFQQFKSYKWDSFQNENFNPSSSLCSVKKLIAKKKNTFIKLNGEIVSWPLTTPFVRFDLQQYKRKEAAEGIEKNEKRWVFLWIFEFFWAKRWRKWVFLCLVSQI